tara:strand:- start:1262 stop:1723 length:462 start_codon:yes stop_codon:yes gene_type:complete
MKLRTQIDEKYKTAFKLKNTDEINTLRLIRSSIKDKDIEKRSSGITDLINDQEIIILLQSLIKQRKDSIESFKSALRQDLVDKETKEIDIINQFLPKQLDENKIKTIIENYVSDNKISSIKDMGKIMQYFKLNHAGVVDMRLVGKIAKELIEN